MDPDRYNLYEDQNKDEPARRSRSHEFDYHPEPELMDECANQEAPSVPTTYQYMPIHADQGNTISSGYFSGATGSLQSYVEETRFRGPVESMEVSSSIPRNSLRRNVHFVEDKPFPPPKRLKQWDSSCSIKMEECLQEMEVTGVPIKEAEECRPSLLRSATVPNQRPVQMEPSDRPSLTLEHLPPVIPIARISTRGNELVSIDTVAQLVRGQYERRNITHTIIDSRFPYEYEAGHIRNAVNLYTSSDVVREVFMNIPAVSPDDDENFINLGPLLAELLSGENPDVRLPKIRGYIPQDFSSDGDDSDNYDDILHDDPLDEYGQTESEPEPSTSIIPVEADPNARPAHVIIFHCEFSSQRGPYLARFLRKLDRYLNYSRYPYLFYPYVYVMMGGYAAFYEKYPELCEPQSYLRMHRRGFRNQLRYFNRLTKEISDVCSECFRNSQFVSLKISSKMEEKEEKPALRSVRTMLLGSQMQKMEEFFEKSMANEDEVVVEPSVERNFINKGYLRLVEHIVRRGDHVTAVYEQGRQMSITSPAKNKEALREITADTTFLDSDDDDGDQRRGYGPSRSGARVFNGPRPVALLTYSDDDVENDENRPPRGVFTGPRPRGKLSFSDCDDERSNNSNIYVHL